MLEMGDWWDVGVWSLSLDVWSGGVGLWWNRLKIVVRSSAFLGLTVMVGLRRRNCIDIRVDRLLIGRE